MAHDPKQIEQLARTAEYDHQVQHGIGPAS
jgi:hypothetical protein